MGGSYILIMIPMVTITQSVRYLCEMIVCLYKSGLWNSQEVCNNSSLQIVVSGGRR